MIIAVDGPAASGKGTLARRLAEHFDYAYLETGLLYRAVALMVLEAKGDPSDPAAAERAARAFDFARLQDPAWRQALAADRVSNAASEVAAVPGVRAALLELQRDFVRRPPGDKAGVVLDGRDTGTVIAPEADVKLYVTASPEVRAGRRHKELQDRGVDSIYARVLEDLKARDTRDSARAAAPLKPAADAIVLDTSALDADRAFEAALAAIRLKTSGGAR
ncbi:MAG TPA: (d)CMP kinase [Alphaproteobacteria bacterium]|nr:(d)CMP kinase [Alphaproteobacteria bacterium]